MSVVINLVRDWEEIQLADFQKYIASWGFESASLERYLKTAAGTKEWDELREEALMTWFNYRHRRVPAQPRKLIPNPSLACPPEVAQGWEILQREIREGSDLTPRLSRKIEDADFNDGMLNDWGFHHFHLGTTPDSKHPRLIQSTNLVLIAIVDFADFYPVDFVIHGRWCDRDILEKAIISFPDRFERVCIKGITDITAGISDAWSVADMRKCNMNSFVKIGDKLYFPPGMGVTIAATSVSATIQLDQSRRKLQILEDRLRERFDAQHRSGEVMLIRDLSAVNSFRIAFRDS